VGVGGGIGIGVGLFGVGVGVGVGPLGIKAIIALFEIAYLDVVPILTV
jgi:hypothetical protein